MDFEHEQAYISTQKSRFKALFNVYADDKPEMFMQYLADLTNRRLLPEIEGFNERIDRLQENGFFEKFLED